MLGFFCWFNWDMVLLAFFLPQILMIFNDFIFCMKLKLAKKITANSQIYLPSILSCNAKKVRLAAISSAFFFDVARDLP